MVLLLTNLTWGKTKSHYFSLTPQTLWIIFPKVLLVTSICPFVWRWTVELIFSTYLNNIQRLIQKWLRNLVSLSKVIDLRTSWWCTMSLQIVWLFLMYKKFSYKQWSWPFWIICQLQWTYNLHLIVYEASLTQNPWIKLAKYLQEYVEPYKDMYFETDL